MHSREAELRSERRCGGLIETDFVGGIFDLLDVAKPRTVLEIGCARGVSTEAFLLRCDRVVAVDAWEDMWAPMYEEFMARVRRYPNIEVVRGRSPDVLKRFGDAEFDLVYIDANHEYEDVSADIKGARRLTSRWLAGHDHNQVHRAVAELGIPPQVFSDTSWLVELIAPNAT
jgi:predicted O-methyltransferase YrrM